MKRNLIFCALASLLVALTSAPMWPQTTQVYGTITENGKELPNVSVVLSNINTAKTYKIKADKHGKFAIIGVAIGDYNVEVSSPDGEKLFKEKMTISPSESTGVDEMKLDIGATKPSSGQTTGQSPTTGTPSVQGTEKSGQQPPKYTKEQIEEIKKQNEKATNTNTLIKQAQDAMNAKNWQEAQAPLQQLTTTDPNNWQYQSALGDTYLNLGQYDQAVASYEKGIQATESITTVDPKNPITDPAKRKIGEAKMLTNEGNAYLKLHKNKEAVDAYTKAASLDPNPGVAYFNLCATEYNTGNTEGALAACDKAIAADPNKADAYFIKGSLMIAGSSTDKEGKVTAPPGTAEALNKYLELAPDGPHANDVKQMLQYIGSKVETTYKKRGK